MSNMYIYVVVPQDRKSREAEGAQMLPPPPCTAHTSPPPMTVLLREHEREWTSESVSTQESGAHVCDTLASI